MIGYLRVSFYICTPRNSKMLETAEECKVKFNYVYIFTHIHQILLLPSHFKSAQLLSIWLELIYLMKTTISAFLWYFFFFYSLHLWPPFLHARCIFLKKEFLLSKYDTLQSACVGNYTSCFPELHLIQAYFLKKINRVIFKVLF